MEALQNNTQPSIRPLPSAVPVPSKADERSKEFAGTIAFAPWVADGWKVGIVPRRPEVPPAFHQPSCQGVCLANSTAIRSVFLEQYRKFVELLFHKAYLWQCIDSGAELDDFYEAGEQVRSLMDIYEDSLINVARDLSKSRPGGGRRKTVVTSTGCRRGAESHTDHGIYEGYDEYKSGSGDRTRPNRMAILSRRNNRHGIMPADIELVSPS
jgi:hypothetical protein